MTNDQAIKLQEEIESMSFNIKAEVIASILIDKGFLPSEITVRHEGCFKRPYRNDILKINITPNEYNEYNLNLSLSRKSKWRRECIPGGIFQLHHSF